MTTQILASDLPISDQVKDAVRDKAGRMGLPPIGQGLRFNVARDKVFFGRREDGKLMLRVSRIVPESHDNDADYHEMHGTIVATRDAHVVADTLDELMGIAAHS